MDIKLDECIILIDFLALHRAVTAVRWQSEQTLDSRISLLRATPSRKNIGTSISMCIIWHWKLGALVHGSSSYTVGRDILYLQASEPRGDDDISSWFASCPRRLGAIQTSWGSS